MCSLIILPIKNTSTANYNRPLLRLSVVSRKWDLEQAALCIDIASSCITTL